MVHLPILITSFAKRQNILHRQEASQPNNHLVFCYGDSAMRAIGGIPIDGDAS